MKPLSKEIMNKIIDVKLAKGKETIGPGSFVTLKRHVRAGGKLHAKARAGRVDKIDGDSASVYWRYNDRQKGSSRAKDISMDKLHLINTSAAHKLHRNLFKGLTDETPKPVAAEKPATPEKVAATEKPAAAPEKAPAPGTDDAGDKGETE